MSMIAIGTVTGPFESCTKLANAAEADSSALSLRTRMMAVSAKAKDDETERTARMAEIGFTLSIAAPRPNAFRQCG